MQGCKHFEPRLFYEVSLNQFVPPDHLVRRLDEVLDLSWVRSATAQFYSHTGKPSVDPEVIAKLMLLGYLYNIPSERQLMQEVQVNLAYRWYLGYDLDETIPDHSVLSKARRRWGVEFFHLMLDKAVENCRNGGLVKGENGLMDSSIVEANASLDSLTTLRYRPAEYWEQLEKMAGAEEPSEQPNEPSEPSMGKKRPRSKRACDEKYSTTDPDASLYRRRGKKTKLAYKMHFVVDDGEGVVTGVATSAASVDDTAMVGELIEQHERRCGVPKRVVADHLYGSQDCLEYLQQRQIETVINQRKGGNKHGGLDKSAFRYDAEKDVYHCPGGQTLRRRRTHKKDRKASYSCEPELCQACPLRAQCVSAKSPGAARQVTRFDTPYAEKAQAVCQSRLGKRLLKKRQTCMEGTFGEGKNWHGLQRARWRGLMKMQIQALLTATVLNVKKLLKVASRRKRPAVASGVVPALAFLYKTAASLKIYLYYSIFAQYNPHPRSIHG